MSGGMTMKTVKAATSMDERLFCQAEKAAQSQRIPRSKLRTLAFEENLWRAEAHEITKSYNEAYQDDLDEEERATLRFGQQAFWSAVEPEKWDRVTGR
jgi:hypothetical protein